MYEVGAFILAVAACALIEYAATRVFNREVDDE